MRRGCLVLLAVPAFLACTSWHSLSNLPPSTPAVNGGAPIRVTRVDQSTLELRRAHVVRDTIFGIAGESEVAIPLSQVTRIEAQKVSGGRTAGLFAGVLGVALVLAAVVIGAELLSTLRADAGT